MQDNDQSVLEIIFVDVDTDTEEPLFQIDYHELHAITEALKLTDRWIQSKIAMREPWGWDDEKTPINKVSRRSLQLVQNKAHWLRRYMATRFQGGEVEEMPNFELELEKGYSDS